MAAETHLIASWERILPLPPQLKLHEVKGLSIMVLQSSHRCLFQWHRTLKAESVAQSMESIAFARGQVLQSPDVSAKLKGIFCTASTAAIEHIDS